MISMASQIEHSFCADLIISLCDNQYLLKLQVDGEVREQLVFQSELLLMDWVGTIFQTAGWNLYVHLQSRQACHRHRVLELGHKLTRQGMMIGISEQ
jgi:hypothetical protein